MVLVAKSWVAMFAVFNSAVLALGGIIIMYTLMVSTMNTAHEGQMLGQKWSSIWIPVRSTIGLALLIPKASGYCMMQIFVMWVVVQGVGAADKIWEAALGYLNRGGVIIKAQTNPALALTSNTKNGIADGAKAILSGQVCMLGLQKQIEARRKKFLEMKQKKSGPCSNSKPTQAALLICNNSVPDFLGTVNAVTYQDSHKTQSLFELPMPNLENTPYSTLTGICGTIRWKPLQVGDKKAKDAFKGMSITEEQLETVEMSRAIAIQQMYVNLSTVAQIMVNNDPALTPSSNSKDNAKNYSLNARQQFGVPYQKSGTPCTKYDQTCVSWGPDPVAKGGVLFSGTEFQAAISAYIGVMAPTVNLINMSSNAANANSARAFINQAKLEGWIMAGSYFFDLVRLNGNAVSGADQTDEGSGLGESDGQFKGLNGSVCNSDPITGGSPLLCEWFPEGSLYTPLVQVQALIDGSYSRVNTFGRPVKLPVEASPTLTEEKIKEASAAKGQLTSSVNGFIKNSMFIRLPGQPGLGGLPFAGMIHFNIDSSTYELPDAEFDCGGVKIVFYTFCFGRLMGNLFYNAIFKTVYNLFWSRFTAIINQVVMSFIYIPLSGMAAIFTQGVKLLTEPGINPIIALANMGVMYINFSSNLWIMLLNLSIMSAVIGPFGIFIFALLALSLPLLMAWVGVMVSVGFVTAYYVPVLPYMIFTFGSLAWLISVIEAMVAAPIVAVGVTHPEGHDAFGKGEAAIMLLMNIFLRPPLMIIGYISGIALCYVGVWILNAGFNHAISFIQAGGSGSGGLFNLASHYGHEGGTTGVGYDGVEPPVGFAMGGGGKGAGSGTGGYSDWAGIYAYFFSILIYTSTYLVIVQQALTLITLLPDKVLRWIGGTPESIGQESAKWGDETKSKLTEAGKGAQDAQGQMSGKLGGYGQKALGGLKKGGGTASATGGHSTPPSTPSKG